MPVHDEKNLPRGAAEPAQRDSLAMMFAKRVLLHSGEIVLSATIVLVFFLGFMGLISFVFPQGTSLREMMLNPQWVARTQQASAVDFDLSDEPATSNPFVALLSNTRRTVKNKRSGAIAWSSARTGMPLENRHSVQTYSRSSAEITFGDDNLVQLGENSLIVIRRLEQDRGTGRKRASMIILDGSLDGRTADDSATSMPMEIVTAGGSTLVIPEGTRGSDFKITVNPDETSTFSVYDGVAEVVSGGRRVLLEANYTITVAGSEAPGIPQALPGRPVLASPANRSVFFYRSAPPQVEFSWHTGSQADTYRLVISRDPDFEDIVHEERLSRPEFLHGNLRAGHYYWRVSALAGWAEGKDSDAQELRMVRDTEPPILRVEFPERTVQDDRVLLRGATERGAEVLIGDSSVLADDSGEFEYALSLQRGLNVVVVEAVDAAGNIAYQSKLVNAKY